MVLISFRSNRTPVSFLHLPLQKPPGCLSPGVFVFVRGSDAQTPLFHVYITPPLRPVAGPSQGRLPKQHPEALLGYKHLHRTNADYQAMFASLPQEHDITDCQLWRILLIQIPLNYYMGLDLRTNNTREAHMDQELRILYLVYSFLLYPPIKLYRTIWTALCDRLCTVA